MSHLNLPLHIRNFRRGDEPALRALFYAAVHGLACQDYTPGQLNAWAPAVYDPAAWNERIQSNRPFVAEAPDLSGVGLDKGEATACANGENNAIAGFADLQATGYIDHFFVAPAFARQGVARALMAHVHAQAAARGITQLQADVSLTAEPFFAANGFVVQERQQVEPLRVVLCNARMVKTLGFAVPPTENS